MSATLSTILRPVVTGKARGLPGILSAGLHAIVRHLACRDAIATLRERDDRALADIGIARCQIEAAVHGFITIPDRTGP